ncbi:CHAP domain-containing protein, partial [Eggerthella sp. BIOML-A4]
MTKVTDYAYSLLNKRITVPYNPYGGQCVSFVDHLATHFTDKNLAYTNAIDLLEKARSQGFKVTRFTGSEIPKVGDIWVTATSNHPFGHTGIFTKVDNTGSYFTTLEQNVDLNADALENGGWVREKNRTLYVDGTFTYDNDILLPQTMVGWFT